MILDLEKNLNLSNEQIIFDPKIKSFIYLSNGTYHKEKKSFNLRYKGQVTDLIQLARKIDKIYKKFAKDHKLEFSNLPEIIILNSDRLAYIHENNNIVNIVLSKELFSYKENEILFVIAHELAHLHQWLNHYEVSQKKRIWILNKYIHPSIKILLLGGTIFSILKFPQLIENLINKNFNTDLQYFLLSLLISFTYYYLYKYLGRFEYWLHKKINHNSEFHADDYSIRLTGEYNGALSFFSKKVPAAESYTHPGTLKRISHIKRKKIFYLLFY